jgi:DNA segregation ATPase FtsK/SpoIIIE, S-DNA-T family
MAYRADDPAPLLPPSIRDRLQGWLWKMLGFLVLVACAALSASLLSWSAADPSLTRATSGAARNLLGPPGAMLSDMLIQMLGLAGVFVLLPPLFWALQLLTAEQPPGLRGKLILAPLAVLFLAGALSSLPSASSWPLHHGYGGVLGDLGLGLLSSLLAHINADRSSAAAGLFYFAAGLMVLMSSLGLTRQELRLICQTNAQPNLRAVADWWSELYSRISLYRESMPSSAAPDPVREPPVLHLERRPMLVEPDPVEADDHEVDVSSSGRDASFDRLTEHTSHAIAKRFAPGASDAQPVADERPAPTLDAPPAAEREHREQVASRRPPLSLLRRAPSAKAGSVLTQAELRGQARLLGEVLADFGVKGEIKDVHPGPVVTLYEFEPARGVKSSRVIGLADDIARSMGAACVRADVIAGRNAIGIELPNPRREKVLLRELLDSEAFRATGAALPLALGKNISGTEVFADLARMPHLLVAGTTGSGKSVGVNAMILSLLYRLSPEQCRFLMIDPKMLELSVYNGIPHLLCPVVTEPAKAVAALNWVVAEMEQRYRRMSLLAVRNIDVFNNRVRHAQRRVGPGSPTTPKIASMPYIVVVVDEFADLMLVAGKEIEAAVQRLAQMARAAGIHLIMATQRPSVDIVTGTIKANFPTRISYKVASKFDSRTILNQQGAEQLLGEGDMLFSSGAGRTLRVHGPFVSDEEVERVSAYLRDQGEPRYVEGITDTGAPEEEPDAGARRARSAADDLYDGAVDIVLNERKASISYLQRRLTIGYNRAADLIERMEREGIVSAPGLRARRQILHEEDARRGEEW